MKKLIKRITFLNLSVKKEIILLFLIPLILISLSSALALIFKQIVIIAFGLGISFAFVLFDINRYTAMENRINQTNTEEFAILFGYFKIYLRNGYNVYSTLKEIRTFANPTLGKLMDDLIENIDEDKTVQPFVKFASYFNEIIIEEMMISIYQMVDDGEQSNYLTQFESIFDKFSDLLYQNKLKAKDSKLGTIGSMPLLASSYTIIVLTIGIVYMLGEFINGI